MWVQRPPWQPEGGPWSDADDHLTDRVPRLDVADRLGRGPQWVVTIDDGAELPRFEELTEVGMICGISPPTAT